MFFQIERVNLEVQAAERDYDLNRAAELKYGTLLQLQKQLKEAEQDLERETVSCSSFPGRILHQSGAFEDTHSVRGNLRSVLSHLHIKMHPVAQCEGPMLHWK